MLSQRRAQEVKRRLMERYGLVDSQIIVTYHGMDLRPNVSNAQKRRVEIYSGSNSQMMSSSASERAPVKRERVKPERKVNQQEEKKAKVIEPSKPDSKTKKRYYVGTGIYHNVLNATDNNDMKAKWISEENYNIESQFQMLFRKLWIGVRGSVHFQDYEQQDNIAYTWDKKSPNLYNFSLVTDYEKDRFGLGFDLNYSRVSFIHTRGNIVELKDVGVYGGAVRGQYKWYQSKKWSSRLGIVLDYPISGSGDLKPKGELGYIGYINLRRDEFISNHSINAKIYYGFKNYKYIQGKQKEEVVGLQFYFKSLNWQ